MTDLQSLAEELKGVQAEDPSLWAFFDVLVPRFADDVELHHHPEAYPMDGVKDAPTLAALLNPKFAVEFMTGMMADYAEVVKSLSVSGDVLVLMVLMTGTLGDGTAVRVPAAFAFAFENGRVTNIDIHSDPADYEPFTAAMAAAGGNDLPGMS